MKKLIEGIFQSSKNCFRGGPKTVTVNLTFMLHIFQIFALYLPNFPNASTELTCSLCDSQNENRGRNFKSQYALIVHLGSKHNVIVDFADETLGAQLQQYSVYKN